MIAGIAKARKMTLAIGSLRLPLAIWAETGGPSIAQPPHVQGYGSKLIARSLAQQRLGAIDYDWQTGGLVVTLRMRRDRLAMSCQQGGEINHPTPRHAPITPYPA